jgi:hypothetical protein
MFAFGSFLAFLLSPYFFRCWSVPPFPSGDDMPSFAGCNHLDNRGDSVSYETNSVCFTGAEQDRILQEAQTCYFAILTTAQMSHICQRKSLNSDSEEWRYVDYFFPFIVITHAPCVLFFLLCSLM